MSLWNNLSLKWKQTILFLLTGLVPLLSVMVINTISFKEIKNINAQNLQGIATHIADKIDRNLFERYGDVQAFGLNTAIRVRNFWYKPGAVIEQVMNKYVDTYDIYYFTLLVDLEGNVIAVNSKDQDGKAIATQGFYGRNFSDSQWFKDVMQGNFYTSQAGNVGGAADFTGTAITPLHVNDDVKKIYPGDDGLTLGFAAPVFDADGRMMAIWNNYAKFSLVEDIFIDSYRQLKAKGLADTEMTLLDGKGRVIVDYDPVNGRGSDDAVTHNFNVLMKLNLAEKGVDVAVKAAKEKQTGFSYSIHARKKIEQAGGYAHHQGALGFPGMNWSVLVRTADQVINAPIIAIQNQLTIITGVFMILILMFGYWIAKSTASRIAETTESIENLAQGNIVNNQSLRVRHGDEISRLRIAYNQMLETLKLSVEQANDLSEGRLGLANVKQRMQSGMDILKAADYVEEKYQRTNGDLPDALDGLTRRLRRTAVQADSIANDQLDHPSLASRTPGELGDAFAKMKDKMQWFASQAGTIANNDLNNERLVDDGEGTLGTSFATMVKNLRISTTEMAKTQSLMNQLPINVMYADTNFNIQYMNPSSTKTLRQIEKSLPIKVDNIIGHSIDVFHKDPQNVRNLLSNPANFPHKAQIHVGEDTLELLVNALYDENKQYLGPLVTWAVITEQVKMQEEAKRHTESMQKIVDHIRRNSETLASASEELTATSQQMAGNAEETSAQANVVSAASEEVNRNVETVATAAEEMSSSIKEIAKNANEAAHVTDEAVKMADNTNATISKLNDSSAEIGQVIKVITSIAEQTNLLALNATIEAARAGEAGKGFAVVANEVKELANQTSKATEDISQRIEAIQNDTQSSVSAIVEIGNFINKINDISNTIASAVEEQTATTNQMTRSVNEATKGTSEISDNIAGVAQAAQSTTQGAMDSQNASKELARMANELQRVVQEA